MKKITLFFMFLVGVGVQGQQTHDITWLMGISNQDASVTINTGDTVRWTWGENGMPHNVSSVDPNAPSGFGSETMTGIGSVYEFTFTEPVIFNYRCSVHPTLMTGTITVDNIAGVDDAFLKNLSYYPTRITDVLHIDSYQTIKEYQVYDVLGKAVLQAAFPESVSNLEINMVSLPQGVYLVKLVSTDQNVAVLKVMKQ